MSKWLERWQRLAPRERIGLAVLAGLILLGWGLQTFYRPYRKTLEKTHVERRALLEQIAASRKVLPNLDEERGRLREAESEIESLEKEIQSVEQRLPGSADLGQLIGELTRQGQGLQLTFESVKQNLKEDADHPEAEIDAFFTSSYEDLINYLQRVEHLSPQLRVVRLEVTEPKEGPRTKGAVRMTLGVPLKTLKEGGKWVFDSKTLSMERVRFSKNPFGFRNKESADKKKEDLKVSGITWRVDGSTAIINDEIVRVGDKIGDLTVTQIYQDRVVVSDGEEPQTLPLER